MVRILGSLGNIGIMEKKMETTIGIMEKKMETTKGIMEKKMETTIGMGISHRDNGKENGNYYSKGSRSCKHKARKPVPG